ncbi:hypothetical protein [Treponema saccharophilum]
MMVLVFGFALLFSAAAVLLCGGIRDFISDAKPKRLYAGIAVLVVLLECAQTACFLKFRDGRFCVVIWILSMLLLLSATILFKKCCFHVREIIAYLNEFPECKETAGSLFVGFINFGTSLPPRGISKAHKTYRNGMRSFTKLRLPRPDENMARIQNLFRASRIVTALLVGIFAAWGLQVPLFAVLVALTNP